MRWRLALAAQGISLFDAEAVLLVDDDERQIGELDVLLEQGVRADDDAGLTAGDLEQRLLSLGRGLTAGEQGHAGADGAAAEEATLGQVAEHAGDRAGMLGGQNLRRGEQRRLTTGVDDGEHGPQGDEGLARADFALEESVHRCLGGEFGLDHRPDLALSVGELKGQSRVEGGLDAGADRAARHRPLAGGERSASGECQLEQECLLVAQPPAGHLDLRPRVGRVDAAQRVQTRRQVAPIEDLFRQGILGVIEEVEHGAHRLRDLPSRQVADGEIDRDEVLALACVEVIQQRVARVGELEGSVELPDGAGEEAARARSQLVLVAVGVEEGDVEVVRAIGDDGLQHPPPPVLHRACGRGLDLRDGHDIVTDLQAAEVALPGAIAAGPEGEQVAHGLEATGLGELVCLDLGQEFGQERGFSGHLATTFTPRR